MAIVTRTFGLVGLVAGGIITAASSSRKKWGCSMKWIRWSDEQELDVILCYLATVLLVTIFRFIVILHSICWDVKVVEIFMHCYCQIFATCSRKKHSITDAKISNVFCGLNKV
jgi:hypothetical protein